METTRKDTRDGSAEWPDNQTVKKTFKRSEHIASILGLCLWPEVMNCWGLGVPNLLHLFLSILSLSAVILPLNG